MDDPGDRTSADLVTCDFLNRFGSDPVCYEALDGSAADCRLVRAEHAEGLARLRMSDVIVRDDLIPFLRVVGQSRPSPECISVLEGSRDRR